jgi:hypothetical protein
MEQLDQRAGLILKPLVLSQIIAVHVLATHRVSFLRLPEPPA